MIEGEKNKDRINKNEPKPRPIAPQPPAHLDSIARKEWTRFAPVLGRLGLLTEVDGASFSAYCELYALNVRVSRALKKCGHKMLCEKTTVDMDGGTNIEVKQNPLVVQKRQILAQMRGYIAEFGLSPSSRGRISVPGAGDDSDYEKLLV